MQCSLSFQIKTRQMNPYFLFKKVGTTIIFLFASQMAHTGLASGMVASCA